MIHVVLVGLILVVMTTVFHALFMVAGKYVVGQRHVLLKGTHGLLQQIKKATLISVLTCWMFLAIVLEALLWASVYLQIPVITELPDIETAMYFSMVTFSTVGYGDISLTGSWRLLTAIQAANGVIVFGWTTALIFYYIQKIYETD